MLNYSKKTGYFLSNINKLKNKKCCNNLNKNRLQQYRVLQTRNNAETTLKISSHSWTRTNDPEITNLEIFAEIILYRLYIRTLPAELCGNFLYYKIGFAISNKSLNVS